MIRILKLCMLLLLFVLETLPAQNKICLTLLVQNDASNIKQCLESVKGVVDCIAVTDAGSKDDTLALLQNFLNETKIPGKIYRGELNADAALQNGVETLKELKADLSKSYLLLLEPTDVLKGNFVKTSLTDDIYRILEQKDNCSNYKERLILASLPLKELKFAPSYECYQCPFSSKKLEGISLVKANSRGEERLKTELELLKQYASQNSRNEKLSFLLAEAHKSAKQYEEAIRWYKTCISQGKKSEENWASHFRIAECFEEMGFWNTAEHWYLEAFQKDATRAEPLQKMANYYRRNQKNDLAYLFAKQGKAIKYPKNASLLICDAVYDYQLDEELSIAAFYTPFKDEGFAAINRLILNKKTPHNIKENSYNNILFYVENLKNAFFKPIEIELPLICHNETYRPMNPSIQKTKEGYTAICRTINFSQNKGVYSSLDPLDRTIRTKNFLLTYDKDLNLLSQKEIIEDLPRKRCRSEVVGLEDCRLIEFKDKFWFTASVFDVVQGAIKICLTSLEKKENTVAKVDSLTPLDGLNPRCEKNWLPFVKEDEIHAIYTHDPFRLMKLNRDNGRCEIVKQYEPAFDFSKFRGSAGPIAYKNGFLVLVHEVVFNDGRKYLHRFLYLDKEFNVKKASRPFTFQHKGIEYCCGMTLDHSDSNCILSFGIEDKEAYLCIVDLKTVNGMLEEGGLASH